MKNSVRRGNYLRDQHGRIVQVNQIKENGLSCLYKGEQNTSAPGVRQSYFEFTDLSFIELNPDLLCQISEFTGNGYMEGYFGLTVKRNMYIDFAIKWDTVKEVFQFDVRMGNMPLVRTFKHLHDLQNFFYSFWQCEMFIDGLVIDKLNER